MGIHNLTDRAIKSAKSSCVLRDGGGLELRVQGENSKSWVLRKTLNGKRREFGLGSLADVPLKAAREKADEYRFLINQGIDPRIHSDRMKRAREVQNLTFAEAAERYIDEHENEWSNVKHRKQWRSTIDTYANPVIGNCPVAELTSDHILAVLKPIWSIKTETATRVRERIEKIIGAARANGVSLPENPATWGGNLEFRLAKPSKIKNERHHPSMPHALLPSFWDEVRSKNTDGSRALQLIILTACRTTEVLNAERNEIDFAKGIWCIPSSRTKTRREHLIPLTHEMLNIIKVQIDRYQSELLFPGSRYGKPMSNATCLKLMHDLGYTNATNTKGHFVPHGFRATFSSWAFEEGIHHFDVIETCLGHNVGNDVHRAYQRSTLIQRRKALLTDWSNFVVGNLQRSN